MIIDQIRKRTRGGTGVTASGKEYSLSSKPYVPQYARSKGQTNVDLTLSGDMLENLQVSDVTNNTVKIKVDDNDYGKYRGTEEGIRVVKRDSTGRIIRIDGHTITDKIVKRPFLHLSKNDINSIVHSSKFIGTFKRAIKRMLNKKK